MKSANRFQVLEQAKHKRKTRSRKKRVPSPEVSCPVLRHDQMPAAHNPSPIIRHKSDPEILAAVSQDLNANGLLPRTTTMLEPSMTSLLDDIHMQARSPRGGVPDGLVPLRSPRPGLSVATAPVLRRSQGDEDSDAELAVESSLADYVAKQLYPPSAEEHPDDIWGQTERDRVYNAIISVPYQLERFVSIGVIICMVSFLSIFTLVPLRIAMASIYWVRDRLTTGSVRRAELIADCGKSKRRAFLTGPLLYDMLLLGMFGCMLVFMASINMGSIYYWLKDMTHEFLKLSVLYTALELSDKICCSFGVDVLEALAGSCTRFACSADRLAAARLASDFAVTLCLLLIHCGVLLGQAMTLSVALNGKRSTLVGLMIAANFGELKGTVFKRFDTTKLYNLTCQDVVERFHLFAVLAFVVAEEMGHSGHAAPSATLLARCARIAAAEACIDVVKHAVLGKLNEVRPGVYREFTRDLAGGVCSVSANSLHRLVGLEPLAAGALFLRLIMGRAGWTLARTAVVLWPALLVGKLVVGYLLQRGCEAYLRHYDAVTAKSRTGGRRNSNNQQNSVGAVGLKKQV